MLARTILFQQLKNRMDGENQAFVYYWLPGLYYQHAGTTIQRRISKKV